MTSRERILSALRSEKTDHIPLLGGFIVSSKHYCEIGGISRSLFFGDPARHALEAYRALGVDGLILLRLPARKTGISEFRNMSASGFFSYAKRYRSPEDVLAHVDSLPSPPEALERFDLNSWRRQLADGLRDMQERTGEIVWMPTQWDIVHPSFEFYNVFGYENYLEFLVRYPEAADRFFGSTVEVKRAISSIIVEVYQELEIVPLIHIGTDICGKSGPVVSPRFLKERFFPHVRRSVEPLVDAGFKLVWHSDGVILPIVDDLLDCGIAGFQGFQWEYGIDLAAIASRRTKTGEKVILFAGPSVSSTLPFGSRQDVREEIEHIIDSASDSCILFFLPANDILPDTPTGNVVEAYTHAREYGG